MKAPTLVARRVAIFADIHGNLRALEAALEDLARVEVDAVLFGGDYALFGPEPAECIVRVAELGDPAIRGETDRWLLEADPTHPRAEEIARGRQRLTENELGWLAGLPSSLRVKPSGHAGADQELLLVHANPTDDETAWKPEEEPAEARRLLGDARAGLIVFGHVHHAAESRVGGQRIASIGAAGSAAAAEWATATWARSQWHLTWHHVTY